MENEPFVSIVIPTTGNVKFIRGLVKSVIELDYPKEKFELILIGDSPTKFIKKHSKIASDAGVNTIVEYKPVAAGKKRNIGSEMAKGCHPRLEARPRAAQPARVDHLCGLRAHAPQCGRLNPAAARPEVPLRERRVRRIQPPLTRDHALGA